MQQANPRAGRPLNIVFVMADDMGYGDVACNGDGRIPTPNMDRVAREGMRFTDAHAASAVCTPTRYGVLTGRYPWRTREKEGVLGGYCPPLIDPARMTVASLLKRHGYATAAIGKWHLGLDWQAKRLQPLWKGGRANEEGIDYSKPILNGPTALGFDRFFGLSGSLNMPPFAFISQDRTVGIPSVPTPGNERAMEEGKPTGLGVPDWDFAQVDVRHCEEALKFIRDHRRRSPDRPFFLYCTPSAPHFPCLPPDFAAGQSGISPRADLILVVDWLVGRLLDCLDELGMVENTLFIVTSDNGAEPWSEPEREHGHSPNGDLRGHKGDIYDGGHREPLLVRWPGVVPAGTVCGELVCLTDLMATCAEILDARLPRHAGEDSVSILPLLRGESGPVREAAVHHSFRGRLAVRRGRWKLIDSCDSGGFHCTEWRQPGPGEPAGQLYDMDNDPAEEENLWLRQPECVGELLALLDRCKEQGHSRAGG